MSSWGNLDNVTATGTVTAYAGNTRVNGSSTLFTSNVKDGDYVTITGTKYQVSTVTSDTVLELTANGKTVTGAKLYVQQGPKYVANVANGNMGNVSIQDIYGVDRVEINVPENKNRGVASHTGWIHYTTYTDAYSTTRHKSEVLVAMSKNFSANITGSLFADPDSQDAPDDAVAADYLLYFTLQPTNQSNTAGGKVTFTSAAASDPTGATLTYQWYENNTTHTYAVVNGGDYSGATTNTLAVANVSNVNGFVYYVTVSGDGGADANNSSSVTATKT